MQTFEMTLKPLNTEELETEYRKQFGERYIGLSTSGTEIRVHLAEPFEKTDESIVRTIFDNHFPEETDHEKQERRAYELREATARVIAFDPEVVRNSIAPLDHILLMLADISRIVAGL